MLYRLKPISEKINGSANCGELFCFNAAVLSKCKLANELNSGYGVAGDQQVHGHSAVHRRVSLNAEKC